MYEYRGGRSQRELVGWAMERQQQQQQQRGGEDVEDAADAEPAWKPVPPVPSSLDLLRASFAVWGQQLTHVVTAQPTVAVALLSMGVLLGIVISLLFTIALDRPPTPYRPIPGAADKAAKPVKGE